MQKGTTDGFIRYPDRIVTHKGVRTEADLLMIPTTPWHGQKCSKGGQCTAGGYDAIGGMGMINLELRQEDSEYEFEFRFVHPGKGSDSAAIEVDELFIEFFDIDKGENIDVVEKIIVDAKQVSGKPSVGRNVGLIDESEKDGSWQWGFIAEEQADNENNPTSLVTLNEKQQRVTAKVRYQNVGSFTTKFGVGKKPPKKRKSKKGKSNYKGRNVFFSLNECPDK